MRTGGRNRGVVSRLDLYISAHRSCILPPTCLPTDLPISLPTYVPTYLPTYMPTGLATHIIYCCPWTRSKRMCVDVS